MAAGRSVAVVVAPIVKSARSKSATGWFAVDYSRPMRRQRTFRLQHGARRNS
jgi:hypothetical protein